VASDQAPHASTFGAYASAHRRWRNLEAEVGARVDVQDYLGFGVRGQLTPRINLRYDLADDWHAYGSWGQFAQAQRVDEYRTETNQTTPDSASRATHVIGGVMRQSEDSVNWRVEGYRHHWSTISPYFDNTLSTLSLLPQLEPDRVLVSPADADAVGLEVSAQHNFSSALSGWGSYTLSRVTDDTNGREVPRSWDQTHAVNAGIAWRKSRSAISGLLGWHSGWPRTPLTMVGATAGDPAYLIVGERNSARWGSYFTADLRLSTSLPLRWGDVSLWFDAANITDRHNQCCVDLYSMLDNSGHSATDAWMPRVIDVGFTYKWRHVP
jgi:outer membrane receptor protein involved in Fe transport